jgi:hypothetical protein
MLPKSVVFILGAGASNGVGYPVGADLKRNILNKLRLPETNKASYVTDARNAGFGRSEIDEFIDHFGKYSLPTIDDFLTDENSDLRPIGKFLIARELIALEDTDALMTRGEQCWYGMLRQVIGRDLEALARCNIRFFTFNYDRSFPYFIYNAFRAYARHPLYQQRLGGLVENLLLPPFHGRLSPLPWQNGARPYANVTDMGIIREASKGIIVVDEARNLRHWTRSPEDVIGSADQVYFLGFAFDPRNMATLRMPQFAHPDAHVHPRYVHKFNSSGRNRLPASVQARLGRDFNMRFFDSIEDIMQLLLEFPERLAEG